jgi:hypothetical protein
MDPAKRSSSYNIKAAEAGGSNSGSYHMELIHTMGTLFVNDTGLYTWREHILDPGALWCQTQTELKQWSCLLNAAAGALKAEKCFWYLPDYMCIDGEWTYTDWLLKKLLISQTLMAPKAQSSRRRSQNPKRFWVYMTHRWEAMMAT